VIKCYVYVFPKDQIMKIKRLKTKHTHEALSRGENRRQKKAHTMDSVSAFKTFGYESSNIITFLRSNTVFKEHFRLSFACHLQHRANITLYGTAHAC